MSAEHIAKALRWFKCSQKILRKPCVIDIFTENSGKAFRVLTLSMNILKKRCVYQCVRSTYWKSSPFMLMFAEHIVKALRWLKCFLKTLKLKHSAYNRVCWTYFKKTLCWLSCSLKWFKKHCVDLCFRWTYWKSFVCIYIFA